MLRDCTKITGNRVQLGHNLAYWLPLPLSPDRVSKEGRSFALFGSEQTFFSIIPAGCY